MATRCASPVDTPSRIHRSGHPIRLVAERVTCPAQPARQHPTTLPGPITALFSRSKTLRWRRRSRSFVLNEARRAYPTGIANTITSAEPGSASSSRPRPSDERPLLSSTSSPYHEGDNRTKAACMASRKQLAATNFPPRARRRFVWPGPAAARRHRSSAHLRTPAVSWEALRAASRASKTVGTMQDEAPPKNYRHKQKCAIY
jgi:hypothetical protein